MFGLALSIGEGHKVGSERVAVTNCSPGVIVRSLQFFEQMGLTPHQIKVTINLHPHLDEDAARSFWQAVTGLPLTQFHKTVRVVSRASNAGKGNVQRHGTCRISANFTRLKQKLNMWMALALKEPLLEAIPKLAPAEVDENGLSGNA